MIKKQKKKKKEKKEKKKKKDYSWKQTNSVLWFPFCFT